MSNRAMRLPRLTRGESALAAVLLLTLPLANPYIRGEGNGYYAYVRSLVIDGDLRFEDEYRRGDPDFVSSSFRKADGHLWPPLLMPTGRVRNQWDVGASLLWTPSFLEAHALILLLDAAGIELRADGYSLPYRLACALATAVYAFAGLLLAYRTAEGLVGSTSALVATAAVWLASSLPVYMYFLPFYSHAPAVFCVALFLWYWMARRPLRAARQWGLWGLMAGLMIEVEHLTTALLLVALLEYARGAVGAVLRPSRPLLRERLAQATAFAAGGTAALLPQLIAKWILHGSPFRTGGLQRFFWGTPHLWKVGFASEHGLFVWTPVLLLALFGLMRLCGREPFPGSVLLVAFAAYYYAVASYESWHGASSFGNRFFVPLSPIFVVGLALLLAECHARLTRLRPGARWAALSLPLGLLVLWNLGLMFQWGTGIVPRQGPVDFALVARNQVATVPQQIAGFAIRYLRVRNQVVREQEGKRLY